jgi:predicted esterase
VSAAATADATADAATDAATDAMSGSATDAAGRRRPRGLFKVVLGPRPALAHAPLSSANQDNLVVFLHGMCAIPEWECPVFAGASAGAWLLCPPGPAVCNGGGRMWVGTDKQLRAQVHKFATELEAREATPPKRRALVGYSLGAPAALRIALAEPGSWQRLMIVNASVTPSAAQLRKAQITRLALVAGARDRTAAKLRQHANQLERAGVRARFFDLGNVGHFFDASSAQRMQPALAWLTADWE